MNSPTRFLALATALFALHVALADPPPSQVTFRPQEQALKVVFDPGGGDYGGDMVSAGPQLVALMQDYGISVTRVGIPWAGVEPERGAGYDWSQSDALIDFLHRRGIEAVVVLFSSPDWARITHPSDDERAPACGMSYHDLAWPLDDYLRDHARWVEAVARRYRGKVRYYEYWNEYDGIAGPVLLRDREGRILAGRTGGDPVPYARWLKAAHAAMRRGNPEAKLAAGSLSVFSTDFLEAVYATVGRCFEAVSFHPYSHAGIDTAWTEALREVCVRYGHLDCEFWITEYDWTLERDQPDVWVSYGRGAAEETVRSNGLTVSAHYPYLTQLTMHTLNDWGPPNPDQPIHQGGFGMVDPALRRKEKYEQFRQALLWRRERLSRERVLRAPHTVCAGESFEIAVEAAAAAQFAEVQWALPEGWRIEGIAGEGPRYRVSVPPDAAARTPYALSAVLPAGTVTHHVEVLSPVYIERVELLDAAGDRRPARLRVRLRHYGAVPRDVCVRVAGLRTEPLPWQPSTIALRPHAGLDVFGHLLPAPHVLPGVFNGTIEVLDDRGTVVAGHPFQVAREAVALRVREGLGIDGAFEDWPAGDWIPIAGEADRAEFRLAWDRDRLYLALRVFDDMHRQELAGMDLWRQDGVQVGFDALRDNVPGASFSGDDYEFQLALTSNGPEVWRYAAPPASYGGRLETVALAVMRTDGCTAYETAIPWAELAPAHPRRGAAYGLAVVVNDGDEGERRVSTWGHGVAEAKRPNRFGRIRLGR